MELLLSKRKKQNIYPRTCDGRQRSHCFALRWKTERLSQEHVCYYTIPGVSLEDREQNSEKQKVSSSVLVLTLSLILLGNFTGSCLSLTELDHLEVPICLLVSFSLLSCRKNGTTIPPSSELRPSGRSLEVTRNQDSSWLVISQSESHSCQACVRKTQMSLKIKPWKTTTKSFFWVMGFWTIFLKMFLLFRIS